MVHGSRLLLFNIIEALAMKIDCILFDLDSVLFIPAAFLENTLKLAVKVMIENGLQADFDEALNKLKEIRAEDSNAGNHFDRLCDYYNGRTDPIIIASGVEKYWDCKSGNMMAAPHAHYVLGNLSQNYPLAIISNGRPVKQAAKLVRLGLSHFFTRYDSDKGVSERFFYASDDPNITKPNPFLWEKARQDMNFSFDQVIMVGDRYWTDMLGAKLLGMTTVKINQGEHHRETMAEAYKLNKNKASLSGITKTREEILMAMEPDFIIENLEELPVVVSKLEN
jgi:HAD superfamily hydrolase (TIGR01549 family)